MKVHANAPLGPKGRETMVVRVLEQGWSRATAAAAAGVSERTCSKWVARYLVAGRAGLLDRSSAPLSIPHRTSEELVEAIVLLRRLRMTGAEIALCLGMALSTVSAVLLRVGLGKLSRLEPPEPPNRYERRHPGSSCTWTSRSSRASPQGAPGIACTATDDCNATRGSATPPDAITARSAGNTSTSASTTQRVWPTSRCSATRKPPPPSASCDAQSRSTPATASTSKA